MAGLGRFVRFFLYVVRPWPDVGDWVSTLQSILVVGGVSAPALFFHSPSGLLASAIIALLILLVAAFRLYCQVEPAFELEGVVAPFNGNWYATLEVRNTATTRLREVEAIVKSLKLIESGRSVDWPEFVNFQPNLTWRGCNSRRRDIDSSAFIEVFSVGRHDPLGEVCTVTANGAQRPSLFRDAQFEILIEVATANASRRSQRWRLSFKEADSPDIQFVKL